MRCGKFTTVSSRSPLRASINYGKNLRHSKTTSTGSPYAFFSLIKPCTQSQPTFSRKAKKFMSDLSPAHMQARAVLRGMDKHMKILFPPQSSHNGQPPLVLPRVPTFSPNERALVGAWKAYLKWEEGNPLELDEKDKTILIQRVQAVYRKAVIRMRYFAEVW
jgi:hypothetical protein